MIEIIFIRLLFLEIRHVLLIGSQALPRQIELVLSVGLLFP